MKSAFVAVASMLCLAASLESFYDSDGLSLLQLNAKPKAAAEEHSIGMEDKGNDLVRRATPDGATNIEFVDRGAGPFEEDGVLSAVRFYSQRAGNLGLRFRIYRPSGNGFSLVGQTDAITVPAAGTIQDFSFSEPVEYAAGDYIGWSHDGNGNIPFDGRGGRVSWEYSKNNAVGAVRGFGSGGARTYSYQLTLSPKTTTTEAPEEEEVDDAAAVGDPHLSHGAIKNDLCCDGEGANQVCKPCSQNLYAAEEDSMGMDVKGNDLVARATPDGATNIEFVDRGAGPFEEDGILTSVRFYAQRAGNLGLRFRIYRPSGGGFSLVGQTDPITVPAAGTIQDFSFSQTVEYAAGDYIGWAHDGNGNIPFDGRGGRVSWEYSKNNAVGAVRGFGSGGARTYSYEVNCAPVTTTTEAPEEEAEAVGDPHIMTNTGRHFDLTLKK